MKTTSGGSHAEERVVGGLVDTANMVGLPTTDSLSVGGSPNDSTEAIEGHQDETNLAHVIPEDDISPDDAPEVVLGDIDEEAEEGAPSMFGRLGRPQNATDAIEAMLAHRADEMLLGLGALCVANKQGGKKTKPRKDKARSQKSHQRKSSKKRKDRRLIEESILRMRPSTSSSRVQGDLVEPRLHRRITPLRHAMLDQTKLDRHEDDLFGSLSVQHTPLNDSATESPSHILSPKGELALGASPPATPTTPIHRASVQFADGVHTTCVGNPGLLEQAAVPGGPEIKEAGIQGIPVLTSPRNEGAISASQGKVDEIRGAALVEAHSDPDIPQIYASTTGTGVCATRSTVAEWEEAGVRVNTEATRPPSRPPVDGHTDSYPGSPYDPNMEVDQVDMQVDFSGPMDKDEDKSEASFGVLPNTTFDQLVNYSAQPLLYSHGPSTEEGDPIIKDVGPTFGADSAMEDERTEPPWKADVSVTATETLQPFSWVPPSISDAFHATFPGVQFARTQMTTFNNSLPVLQYRPLSDPYTVDTTTSEDTRLWQVASPQDIPWPLVSDGVHPSPSVEVGLSKEPQPFYAKHSPTHVLSAFSRQTTSCSSFHPPSPPMSGVSPVSVFPPLFGSIEGHKEGVKAFEGDVDSESAVVQREASPPRSLYTHNAVGLDVSSPQSPPSASTSTSSPVCSLPLAVDTTAVIHSGPTPASPIEHYENEIEGENRDSTKSGHLGDVHEIVHPTLAMARPATKESGPPMNPVATAKLPPPVPPRVVGSKRKFVDDQGTRYNNSINLARKVSKLPRSKRPKIDHGAYSTQKRLGEVKAMHRREGEGTKLPEAIKFATRHTMPVWSSSRSPTRDQKSGETPNWGA